MSRAGGPPAHTRAFAHPRTLTQPPARAGRTWRGSHRRAQCGTVTCGGGGGDGCGHGLPRGSLLPFLFSFWAISRKLKSRTGQWSVRDFNFLDFFTSHSQAERRARKYLSSNKKQTRRMEWVQTLRIRPPLLLSIRVIRRPVSYTHLRAHET